MGFSPGPCVDGIRIDRFETPRQPVVGSFITAIVKQLNEEWLLTINFGIMFKTTKVQNPLRIKIKM